MSTQLHLPSVYCS